MQCQTIEFLPFNIAKMVLKISPECKHHGVLWQFPAVRNVSASYIIPPAPRICSYFPKQNARLSKGLNEDEQIESDKGVRSRQIPLCHVPSSFAYYEHSSSHNHINSASSSVFVFSSWSLWNALSHYSLVRSE